MPTQASVIEDSVVARDEAQASPAPCARQDDQPAIRARPGREPFQIALSLRARERSPASDLQFMADGRHLLKQVANRLGLGPNVACVIVGRPSSPVRPAEVVLRAGRLLIVITRDEGGATVAASYCEPGVAVRPQERAIVPLAVLHRPEGRAHLLALCRRILDRPAPTNITES